MVMSVADRIEEAATRLRKAGVGKPRREANRLWAWLNRVSPGEAYLNRERSVDAAVIAGYETAVARRAAGEPMAYLLGHAGFRRLEIGCDRRALIPRPETEGVVDLALVQARTGRALDLGTGTGCLALALADEGGFEQVVGVDCALPALQLAADNAARTGLRVHLVRSDWGSALSGERFDLIVSNPPYLTEAEYQALDPSVKRWEPREALVSGADGLAATGRILREGIGLLRAEGWLVMELDSTRGNATAALARAAGWSNVALSDDLFGRARYLTARRG